MQDSARLEDLETRVAFQEDTIDKLSDVVARQEKELDQLKRMVLLLSTQVNNFDSSDSLVNGSEEPPPHY